MSNPQKSPIREAFTKAKQDILSLAVQIELLKREIQSLKEVIKTTFNNQTDRQTDNSTRNKGVKVRLNQEIYPQEQRITKLEKVTEVLNSLDNIKKELRLKLKKLTHQELAVFTTIYQLEEEGFIADYPLLSQKLNLTESSIRDYVQRILKKGLPLIKTKENNKRILLSISLELKKIASLTTILQLREL